MFARRVAVIGTGYVGLTTGACLASLGHRVSCADLDRGKVERLRRGEIGIREDGLGELVEAGIAAGRLSFVVGAAAALAELAEREGPAEVVFLCVPTPMGVGGVADLSAVEAVVEEIRSVLAPGAVVVNKSTVPVGTAARTEELLDREDVAVVSNPEFLREGSAVKDFLNPDRIVVGASKPDAAERVAALFARLGAPTVLTDAPSAEMIKYAANCFLAMKLSYVNALAEMCERLDADIADVTDGMGFDRRIGQAFLTPGPGLGRLVPAQGHQRAAAGGRFGRLRVPAPARHDRHQHPSVPADRRQDPHRGHGRAAGLAGQAPPGPVRAHVQGGHRRPARLARARRRRAAAPGGRRAHRLRPRAARRGPRPGRPVISVADDPYVAAKDVDAIVILTEWPEFRTLDWPRLAALTGTPTLVDTRNLVDPDVAVRAGFSWIGLGRRVRSARSAG